PDAVWLSTALLVGLARGIKQALGVPVLCSLQGEDSFLDGLPEPWRRHSWDALAERARDVDACIAPSRYYAELMGRRMKLAPGKMRVIPNGVALDETSNIEHRTSKTEPVVGYLARFIE